jgi:dienelactone hydrolase
VQQPLTHSQPQGFIGVPPAGNGRDVSVLHAWRGMNGTLRASCTRLAQSAFVAFAPDLHHDEVAEYPADVGALGRALGPTFSRPTPKSQRQPWLLANVWETSDTTLR